VPPIFNRRSQCGEVQGGADFPCRRFIIGGRRVSRSGFGTRACVIFNSAPGPAAIVLSLPKNLVPVRSNRNGAVIRDGNHSRRNNAGGTIANGNPRSIDASVVLAGSGEAEIRQAQIERSMTIPLTDPFKY
jgi:hypothetical protein